MLLTVVFCAARAIEIVRFNAPANGNPIFPERRIVRAESLLANGPSPSVASCKLTRRADPPKQPMRDVCERPKQHQPSNEC